MPARAPKLGPALEALAPKADAPKPVDDAGVDEDCPKPLLGVDAGLNSPPPPRGVVDPKPAAPEIDDGAED